MREINFLAYVKKDNGLQEYAGTYEVTAIDWIAQVVQVQRASVFAHNVFPLNVVELRQYIEHNDINGKKIHDGDIITTQNIFYPKNHLPLVISWNGAKGRFETNDDEDKNRVQFLKDSGFYIIGNIYENPELTKGEL